MALSKVKNSGVQGLTLSSTSTALSIDANGHITMPNQPAFLATFNGNSSNLANDNSSRDLPFNTEVYDKNSDFDTSNYTFTAPVDGLYDFGTQLYLQSFDVQPTYYIVYITTSNRDFYHILDPRGFDQDLSYYCITVNITCNMDASDTCKVRIIQSGGSVQTDVTFSNGTWFFGRLVQ